MNNEQIIERFFKILVIFFTALPGVDDFEQNLKPAYQD